MTTETPQRQPVSLQGSDIHLSLGDSTVLRGIDIEVPAGHTLAVIGPSGSGKSTLLRCVNLLEPVVSGRIVVRGEEITAARVDVNVVRRGIGIVF